MSSLDILDDAGGVIEVEVKELNEVMTETPKKLMQASNILW